MDESSSEVDNQEKLVTNEVPEPLSELPPGLMAILRANPIEQVNEGIEVHEEISSRWNALAVKGVEKEDRKELLQKYPAIKNCKLLLAPKLNDEIKECLPELLIKQDIYLQRVQDQMASGLSAMGTIDNSPIDDFLFGNKLQDLIKERQEIKKATTMLKIARTPVLKTVSNNYQNNYLNFKRQPSRTRFKKEGEGKRRVHQQWSPKNQDQPSTSSHYRTTVKRQRSRLRH